MADTFKTRVYNEVKEVTHMGGGGDFSCTLGFLKLTCYTMTLHPNHAHPNPPHLPFHPPSKHPNNILLLFFFNLKTVMYISNRLPNRKRTANDDNNNYSKITIEFLCSLYATVLKLVRDSS